MRKNRYMLVLAVSLAFACGSIGTASPPGPTPPQPSSEIPDWVVKLPRKSDQLCATGAVGATYFQQDGRKYAAEAARNALARSIRVTINSLMEDVQTSYGGWTRNYVTSEVATVVQDGVVEGAEIISYWYDKQGAFSQARMTYALACIDTNKPIQRLTERLKEEHPEEEEEEKIKSVRERAQEMFDELEAMETRHAQSSGE